MNNHYSVYKCQEYRNLGLNYKHNLPSILQPFSVYSRRKQKHLIGAFIREKIVRVLITSRLIQDANTEHTRINGHFL